MDERSSLLFLLTINIIILLGCHCSRSSPPLPLPPPSPPTTCSDELVTFSACLPYISAFPNNISEIPPPQCCDVVSTSFASISAICLCYLVHRPGILGFPLNSTKLMSLTSVCPEKRHGSKVNFSLEYLCSGSTALPPLNGIRDLDHSKQNNSDPDHSKPNNSVVVAASPPPSLMGSSQESDNASEPERSKESPPTEQSNSSTPPETSTAVRSIQSELFLLVILTVLVCVSHTATMFILLYHYYCECM